MAEKKPRPKAPSAHDDFAEIRRRRDEIQRDEGKPPEEKPKDDPMHPLTGIFFEAPRLESYGIDFSEGEE